MNLTHYLHGRRLVMITHVINQPRVQRRVRELESVGLELWVYGFDRRRHGESKYLDGTTAKIKILGSIEGSGVSWKRVWVWLRAMIILYYHEGFSRKSFIYYCGFDTTFLDLVMIGGTRIYETSDLRFSTRHGGWCSRLLTWMEDRVLRRCALVTVTSRAFLGEFEKRVPNIRNKGVVLENKLPKPVAERLVRPTVASPLHEVIRIGYVGMVRYLDIMIPFLRCVGDRSERYEFHIFGDGYELDEIMVICERYENVHYHGSFRNPEDLNRVYSRLDLGYAVYDNRDYNVQLALPNKLYEHVFFGTPLIVAADTELARRVNEWGVGYCTDPREAGWAERFLDKLDPAELQRFKSKCVQTPETELVTDVSPLVGAMSGLGESS